MSELAVDKREEGNANLVRLEETAVGARLAESIPRGLQTRAFVYKGYAGRILGAVHADVGLRRRSAARMAVKIGRDRVGMEAVIGHVGVGPRYLRSRR